MRLAVEESLERAGDRDPSGASAALPRIADRLELLEEQVGALIEQAVRQKDDIDRWRQGYDWVIFKRFAQRLVHTVDGLGRRVAHHGRESAVGSELETVRQELVYLLESNDVIEWVPENGAPVRDHLTMCEVVGTRNTPSGLSDGEVVETVRPGFLFEPPDGPVRVLNTAQVIVAKDVEEILDK